MVGVPVLFGAEMTPLDAFQQIPGESMRMSADQFTTEISIVAYMKDDAAVSGQENNLTDLMVDDLREPCSSRRTDRCARLSHKICDSKKFWPMKTSRWKCQIECLFASIFGVE